MADAQVLGQNIPLPSEASPAEMLLAQGLQEQIAVGKGQLGQLATVSHLLGIQNAQTSILKYRGDPKSFQDWMRSLEKHALLIGNAGGA